MYVELLNIDNNGSVSLTGNTVGEQLVMKAQDFCNSSAWELQSIQLNLSRERSIITIIVLPVFAVANFPLNPRHVQA